MVFFEEVDVTVPYNAISSFHQAVRLTKTRRALGTTSKCENLNLVQSVPITCFHEFCGQGVQSLISKVREMYIKAGYAERVEVAYGKVARNVSLVNDSTPGTTQIPLYKPPVCAGSQAGRTVVLVPCIAWRRRSWDSLLSSPRQRDKVDQVYAYILFVEWCRLVGARCRPAFLC